MRANETNLYGCVLVALAVAMVFGQSASADTNVGSLIATDTHWTATGSPYVAADGILIAAGASLRIDPGVEVRLGLGTTLKVGSGELLARGTTAEPICFTGGAHITFEDASVDASFDEAGNYIAGSIIEYAVIENAAYATSGTAIRICSTSPYISHNLIRNNAGNGIFASSADNLHIVRNIISNNSGWGVYLDDCETATFSGNIISGNSSGMDLNSSNNIMLIGDRIFDNTEWGIFIFLTDGVKLSADLDDPTWIFGNGLHNVSNYNSFQESYMLDGPGNVDGRYVWWGTTDEAEITEGIYDYLDKSNHGIVFYQPWAVPEPATLLLLAFGGLAVIRRQRRQK